MIITESSIYTTRRRFTSEKMRVIPMGKKTTIEITNPLREVNFPEIGDLSMSSYDGIEKLQMDPNTLIKSFTLRNIEVIYHYEESL